MLKNMGKLSWMWMCVCCDLMRFWLQTLATTTMWIICSFVRRPRPRCRTHTTHTRCIVNTICIIHTVPCVVCSCGPFRRSSPIPNWSQLWHSLLHGMNCSKLCAALMYNITSYFTWYLRFISFFISHECSLLLSFRICCLGAIFAICSNLCAVHDMITVSQALDEPE